MKVATIILAAGQGTRMKSKKAKVLHTLGGRPLLFYVLDLAAQVNPNEIFLVLGHQASQVEEAIAPYRKVFTPKLVWQTEQLGTGHAVAQVLPFLPPGIEYVLILYGDTPLLIKPRIEVLLKCAKDRSLALLSTQLANPSGYGRLLRNPQTRQVERIVEERDCTMEQKQIREVNAGIYAIEAQFLQTAIKKLTPKNAQKELYLTDVVAEAASLGEVQVIEAPPEEVQGINDRIDLSRAEQTIHKRINQEHMQQGVSFLDPDSTYIEFGVRIGVDTQIGPNVHIKGTTSIGSDCVIETGCVLTDAKIADQCHLKPYTIVTESQIENGVQLGPFSHLRPHNYLGPDVRIGNFVELKKTYIGMGSKANHLSYLGDAEIGSNVNIGCGTITCNYDGYQKHRTIIEDGAFVGSDTQLVAPVRVGKEAVVGAGTTVTEDVPNGALALSRTPQLNRLGYREKKRSQRRNGSG